MGERKVLNKYYSPDFDPAKVGNNKNSENGVMNVRMMIPFTIACNRCRSYTGRGTKLNMDKETVRGQDYFGIRLHRFYARCINCPSEFIFRTDPQNSGYIVESGVRVSRKNVEDSCSDDNEIKDSMEKLENKMVKLKRGMVDLDDLELIKCVNKRQARVCEITDRALKRLKESSPNCGIDKDNGLNEEDEKLVRSIFGRKEREFGRKIDDEDLDDGTWGGRCKSKKIEFSGKSKKKLSSMVKVSIGPKERLARESPNTSVALKSLCQNYEDNGDE